ncbi:anthranilate synthase component I family protein [Sulfuriroseicoccus oceanibius]|uniref:Anthranilate synthase component I family protein n=1 Tax=Sulfuriroseicoccus oceanibius TaxID=2707525 RepID=A0A6B3LFH0_9BACT|nr:anthranilate synthase component I family protein [Sulfuriroseicoccus oceanibius]QQL45661.1 anthranilate synthase component I family protein [Sulfuriroseicoccus oceanibius]
MNPSPRADLEAFRKATTANDGDGVVWLDAAGRSEGEVNPGARLFSDPVAVVTGNLMDPVDRDRLRAALAELNPERGALAGAVDYDGSFQFGVYTDYLTSPASFAGRAVEDLPPPLDPAPELQPEMSRGQFCDAVARIKEYIAAGDIYQVNLAQRFSGAGISGAAAVQLYQRLRGYSPAPRGAFVSLQGRQLLSASPELFLEFDPETRRLVTRPIKGTRPRRSDQAADAQSREELLASEKERAELIMITDLERNDLGQVCEFGSVAVSEIACLESFEQVYHLVSTVGGTLASGVDAIDAMAACYPGGSITGAPKKRAMEIIEELEPCPRGPYTGAIGFFGADGSAGFNIAIRTMVATEEEMSFHVGAGIVADSDPAAEYEETLHKGKGMALALGLPWSV